MGGLLGQHRDDARLAVAGAALFAASFLLMRAFGTDFELPKVFSPSSGSELTVVYAPRAAATPAMPLRSRDSEAPATGKHSVEVPATASAPTAPLLPLTLPVLPSSTSLPALPALLPVALP